MEDHEIVIATGRNRKSTSWKNEYLSWSDLVARFRKVRKTSEVMSGYDIMSKDEKSAVKDGPGFVGGFIAGGRRNKGSVQSRSLITLDIDHASEDFLFECDMELNGYAHVLYSTHSHREKASKYRLIVPTDREMTPDEYVAVSRKLAYLIGMDYFDKTTFQAHRLMYFPSCSHDAEPFLHVAEGALLEVDTLLRLYGDWTDPLQWHRHKDEDVERKTAEKMEDPREKDGIIGAFCRAYSISEAIDAFLSDSYSSTDQEDRYSFIGGSSSGGLVVYEDTFAYSHHESDPVGDRSVNAFDLVRLHKFGKLDEKTKDKTNHAKLPSYIAMREFAAKDKRALQEHVMREFEEDEAYEDEKVAPAKRSDELGETIAWETELEFNPKTMEVLSTSKNVELILSHGELENILAFDGFKNAEVVRGALPWRKRQRERQEFEPWLGADDKRLMHWMNKKYGIGSSSLILNALTEVVHANTFHPVKDYLENHEWDGVERANTLFIDYLGAEDSAYTREVTRKTLLAAVKRIYEPGCKFDEMLVLVGAQGAGKSSLLAKMGRGWFSDSLKSFKDNKEASEHLQGAWIVEIGELAAMKKAEVEEIKQFLSKVEDRYRVAFDRVVSDFPRKCILVGTTNNKNFLYDPTGNRRFWPLDVHPDKREHDHWTHLDDDTVGQIWAEILHAYKEGETLQLSKEGADEARRQQEGHYEVDIREGLIEDYLNKPLPEDWDRLDVYERREYLDNPTGDTERTRTCAVEIWEECLGNSRNNLRAWDAKTIADIIRRVEGWQDRTPAKTRFRLYGMQKTFIRV